MSLQDELAIIKGDADIVRVEDIEQWAREHRDSDWHRRLEWNDTVGALNWRHQQIRVILITHFRDEKQNVRQMISLTIDRVQPGGGYRSMESIMRAPNLRAIMLQDCLNDLARVKAKYEHLQEYAQVWDSIEQADRATASKRRRSGRGRDNRRSA
jgi:hypothetical protein